jgi:hypothetical protein
MGSLAAMRRLLVGLAGTLLGFAALVLTARADEVASGDSSGPVGPPVSIARADGFVIHDAVETLRGFCATDSSGVLWFRLPGGASWELVTSATDPAIANPGDGSFHPFAPAEVRAALDGIGYPLRGAGAVIFLLPYPRRVALQSAAGPGLILLAPGVQPLSAEHQHAELTHEMGHVVQYALMPDADDAAWEGYRRLRGIADVTVYNAAAPHADRPHEIFAEDFRATFGDPLARYSGTIENPALALPASVPGLERFMLGLAGPAVSLAITPNPTHGATRFMRVGNTAAPLELFDLNGRRIAALTPVAVPGGTQWCWDGRDARGRRASPGVFFARERGQPARATRFTLAP